jgi:hypothetical protein
MKAIRGYLKEVEDQVSTWAHISVHPHRFGGREFRLGNAEVGHLHHGGEVEIPFPRSFRDELLAQGLAEKHRWVPDSGWITFRVRGEDNVKHALWLLRLSYLRFALKSAPDARKLFEQESEQLRLSPQLKTLLRNFVPLVPGNSKL